MLTNAPVIAVLPCVDMDGAIKFYGEVLGLTQAEIPGVGEDRSGYQALFQCGEGTHLLVYKRDEPTKAEHTAAGFMVEDIDAVVNGLIAKGVKMEVFEMPGAEFDERGIATYEGLRGAWFKDPEGNILAVNQMP